MSGEHKLVCSFCGKNEDQVAKLCAGRAGYICNTCAATAHRIMSGPGAAAAAAGRRLSRLAARIAGLLGQRRSFEPSSAR